MNISELERELRRNQDTLASVGLGVLAFGVWSVIEVVIMFIIQMPKLFEETVDKQVIPAVIAIASFFLLIILAVILLLRFYIWRSAIAEAQRGVRKKGYLFVAGFLAVMSLTSLVSILLSLIAPGEPSAVSTTTRDPEDLIITAIIQLTSLVTLLEMIAASRRVHRIRRELESRRG